MLKNREFPGTLSFKKPMTNFYWPFLFSYVFIITHWKKKKCRRKMFLLHGLLSFLEFWVWLLQLAWRNMIQWNNKTTKKSQEPETVLITKVKGIALPVVRHLASRNMTSKLVWDWRRSAFLFWFKYA